MTGASAAVTLNRGMMAGTADDIGAGGPRTQGERIKWIRIQMGRSVGLPFGEPMPRDVFADLIAKRSGEEARAATTIFRWEDDEGRGPTLKEGVAMARLVGKTAEWLSALDDAQAEQRHRPTVRHEGDEPGQVSARPEPRAAKKQGHGRGRAR